MGLRFGILLGIATILCYVIAYLIDIDIFLSTGIYWGTMILYVATMYVLANKVVEMGVHDFRGILKQLFICFLIANLMYYAFYYIMCLSVPEIMDIQIERMQSESEDLALTDADKQLSIPTYLLSYFQTAIGGFILSAIIAYSKKQS